MSKGICFLCGNWEELERHHVFGGSRRNVSERYGATVDLCACCHRLDADSAHRSGATRLYLQKISQREVMRAQGWGIEEFRAAFGINVLDPEELEEDKAEEGVFSLLEELPLFI